MPDRARVIKSIQLCLSNTVNDCRACDYKHTDNCDVPCDPFPSSLLADVLALLKAQAPDEDWISRKRLRDEIQYYIEEAGWGDEVNKVLGWCLEFIDNQRAVTWNDA